ncbi:MAG: GntR family transcriptional regulator [Roseococcus sp.]|nr:GntR family transcriptional regulator [Roseococcus sp.]
MRGFFNPYPKYLHVRRILLERIQGVMAVGDQLPTEQALRTEFTVSRETVRAALALLEQDGIIARTPGRGTFIARMPSQPPEQRLTGMTEDFSALQLDTEARVLHAAATRPPANLAAQLGLDATQPLFRITRLRRFEALPLAWHDAWMPEPIGARIAALDLRRTSIERELRETLGLRIQEEQQTIEALAADIEAAPLLEVPIGAPLLCLTRRYALESGGLAVHFRSLYRSDRYFYTVQLAPPPATPRKAARKPRG